MYIFIILATAVSITYGMTKKEEKVDLALTNKTQQMDALTKRITDAIKTNNAKHFKSVLASLDGKQLKQIDFPLVYLAVRYSLPMVEALVEKGISVNKPNNDGHKSELGWTPLMLSSAINHENITRYLLAHKAGVNRRSANKSTALIEATRCALPQTVLLLLQHRADISAKNDDEETAMSIAQQNGIQEVIAILDADHGKATNT